MIAVSFNVYDTKDVIKFEFDEIMNDTTTIERSREQHDGT